MNVRRKNNANYVTSKFMMMMVMTITNMTMRMTLTDCA